MKTRFSDKILLLFTLILLLHLLHTAAQPVQKITPAQWHQLNEDKALNYKNDRELFKPLPDYKPNAFQKAVTQFFSFLMGPAGTLAMWVFVIGLIIFVIYKLIVQNGSFLFAKNKKLTGDSGIGEQENEDLESTDWDKLLQQAMAANDTRMAVRYRYMWLLQILQQSGLIKYRNDKTNYDYYNELYETEYRQTFKQLSRLYEYAWYGNFTLTSGAYNDYLAHFDNLKNHLSR